MSISFSVLGKFSILVSLNNLSVSFSISSPEKFHNLNICSLNAVGILAPLSEQIFTGLPGTTIFLISISQ
jgi:hypothetical protein